MIAALAITVAALLTSVGDTLLPPAKIRAFSGRLSVEKMASPVTVVKTEDAHISSQTELSSRIPGLHIPKYGASLTSTIYLRGFGSRMDNPVLGLYLDGIPIIDKNTYDMNYPDLDRVTVLRGPQGTLFGRNTLGGVLSLQTKSPQNTQGVRLNAEYGTANTTRVNASIYKGNHGFSASFLHSNGYFLNKYSSSMCDPYTGGMFRWKWVPTPGEHTQIEHFTQAAYSTEGGFAYGRFDGEEIKGVNYNDEGSYRRCSLIDGSRLLFRGDRMFLDSSASVQILSDDMRMDQDFTPEDIFTLQQRQHSGTLTLELMLRPAREFSSWHPLTGMFVIGQYKNMHAPVLFKQDGIKMLILDNANSHIPSDIGYLDIPDTAFSAASDFVIGTVGAAIFHESVFDIGKFTFTAGIRLDGEWSSLKYDCSSSLHYQFVPTMASAKPYNLSYMGTTPHCHLVLLPKLSLCYELSKDILLFATLSRGFRAGGFNTQIFSDILQIKMRNGLMEQLGVYLDHPVASVGANATEYKPELAWNQEVGLRIKNLNGFSAAASIYRMDGKNQQLTVFPPGNSIGRMMANAAKSRSFGAEAEIHYRKGHVDASASYSYCNARFISYESSGIDYSGNRLPYIPAHTLFAGLSWRESLGEKHAAKAEIFLLGNGPLFWNEDNTLKEGFHISPGAKLAFSFPWGEIYCRGNQLDGKQYPVFYFKTVGREFFALSRPIQIMTGITINL